MHLTLLLCLSPWFAGPGDAKPADVVELAGGKTLTGRVLYEGADEIVVKSGRGEVEVARADVQSIHSVERSLKEFLQRYDDLPRGDSAPVAALARWCAENGLPNEAHNLWLRVVLANPDDAEALAGCGGKKSGTRVLLPDEKR